ncbi:MAG: RNA polymerase sigma factor [Longimicrobiales bacterium]
MSTDWESIYRDTYPALVRFLHRKVWDADRARDLAQEAFVRALTHEPQQPRAWLFRVAGNLARDEARQVLRRRKHLTVLRGGAETASAVDPRNDLERAERETAVRQALERLSERDRDALLLWDAGLDYTQIAEHTGLAVGAVGTTLARARRRLVEAYHSIEGEHVARG